MQKQSKRIPAEFRFIRAFTLDHNVQRLRKHVARVQKRLKKDRFIQIIRLKRMRQRLSGQAGRVKT